MWLQNIWPERGHREEEKKEKPYRVISGDDGRSALLWNPGNSWDRAKVKLPDAGGKAEGAGGEEDGSEKGTGVDPGKAGVHADR